MGKRPLSKVVRLTSAKRNESRRIRMGKVIYRLRNDLGLTIDQCGEAVGVTRWTWMRWEEGRHSIPSDMLPVIATLLSTSVAALYGPEPDKKETRELARAA